MAKAKQKDDGKPVYISFTKVETAALRKLGWRERWLYHELKWLANFKTGKAGNFFQQCITYEQLAVLVCVPSSQGREGDRIDDKEAARLMMRLNAAGLIGEIERRDNGGLLFCLPLSPIDKKAAKAARDAERLPVTDAAKLPAENVSQVAANDDAARDSGHSSVSRSVLTSPYGEEHTFFNTDASGQPAPTPADPGGETPVACGDSPPAAAGGAALNPIPETPTETPPPNPAMTTADIEAVMDAWGFNYARTSESRKFYKRWLQLGIDYEQLMDCVREVSDNWDIEQTPAAVDRFLRKTFRSPARRYAGVCL